VRGLAVSTRSEVRFKVEVKLSTRGASFSKAKVQIKIGGVKRKKRTVEFSEISGLGKGSQSI
jgi:hypothetical protein